MFWMFPAPPRPPPRLASWLRIILAVTPGENRDILDGIGSATESLARGLTDGVSGLYKNPMRGAERDGFAGFAKGMGTGVLGLVVKPVVGVTDAATDVLRGLLAWFVVTAEL